MRAFRNLRRTRNIKVAKVPRGLSYSGPEFTPGTLPGSEGTHYFFPDTADASYADTKGFNLIRLATLWERMQPTVGGSLDSTYMGYIDTAISLFGSYGLKILIEPHNYGGRDVSGVSRKINDGTLTYAHFNDFWTRVAQRYLNESNVWGYDLMNEPNGMPVATSSSNYNTTSTWYNAAQGAINSIRAVDSSKYIVAETDNYSGLWNFFNTYGSNPTPWWSDSANKLYYSMHVYFDSDHSGAYSGVNAYFIGSQGYIRQRGDYLEQVVEWARNRNVLVNAEPGIFLGEYGVMNTSVNNDDSWYTALNDLLNVMDKHNIPGTHWAYGEGYISPTTVSPTNSYSVDRPQMKVLEKHLGIMS